MLSYVLEARPRLSQMQNIVHENIQKSQAKQKRFYDQKSLHRKFISIATDAGSKLESKWQGPYTVTNVFYNGLNYELDREKGRKQKRTYHKSIKGLENQRGNK